MRGHLAAVVVALRPKGTIRQGYPPAAAGENRVGPGVGQELEEAVVLLLRLLQRAARVDKQQDGGVAVGGTGGQKNSVGVDRGVGVFTGTTNSPPVPVARTNAVEIVD